MAKGLPKREPCAIFWATLSGRQPFSVRTFAPLREIFLRFLAYLPRGRDYGTSDIPLWLLQTSVR